MKHELIQRENYLLIVDDSKKTIAHLPLNGAPVLEGVDLLPPIEDDVEKLADEIYPETYYSGLYVHGWLKAGFIKGYNKAKEKYKFTEEDLMEAIDMAREQYKVKYTDNEYEFKYPEDEVIQSIQKPKMPVGFECEMINCDKCVYVQGGNLSPDCCNQLESKTTTNSQGQTVWVGKYIFND